MNEEQFIRRKADHIRHSLSPESEAGEAETFSDWNLLHDSLPDLDLNEISLETRFLGRAQRTPFFIAGMTAGHPDAERINERLSSAAAERGWGFGLGSQRRELEREYQDPSSLSLRSRPSSLSLISNLGVSQLIVVSRRKEWSRLRALLERGAATALAIHLNPLQEAIQEEGTPQFRGSMRAIEECIEEIRLPVILKETGSGMSEEFLRRISRLSIHAVDVSGLGGTHWGRIEGMRAPVDSHASRYGRTFSRWGISTTESILNARRVFATTETRVWASGGVRTGLDAAKALALGASAIGFARPALEAALQGEQALHRWMEAIEGELRIAMFCTNSATLEQLDSRKIENIRGKGLAP